MTKSLDGGPGGSSRIERAYKGVKDFVMHGELNETWVDDSDTHTIMAINGAKDEVTIKYFYTPRFTKDPNVKYPIIRRRYRRSTGEEIGEEEPWS